MRHLGLTCRESIGEIIILGTRFDMPMSLEAVK